MKKTMYFNMNAPEYSDPIDVKNLSDNFNVIDYGLMTSRCSKSRTTNSINERAVLPYYKIVNDNDFDVVVINRNFDNVETTIKAGEELKVNVSDINRSMNYMVKDLHEVTFEWFITVEDAIKEGGGGSGGTSNYNDLTNKPQINSVTLSGNKTLTDLGITNSSGKIKSDLLPAFVDNYDSYANRAAFPATGVEDRLYLAKDTRLSYVWDSGTSDYVVVGSPLALGESSSTAYRGDRGKTAYDHSQATHANVNATVVAASTTNGNIKIDGVEKTVYTHPKATGSSDTNPHGTTASDVGLGNVGNFKAVSTSSQSLSDTEKSTARANIGAGTSSFDGKYSSLSGIPSTFTPATHSHAGDGLTVKSTAYSKATAEANITKDSKIDVAIGQLDYRTDVLKQNKVDKTAVSDSVSETTATITVPAKAKAVAVQKMYGKTVKITPESGDPYLANAANESVVSRGINLWDGNSYTGYPSNTSSGYTDDSNYRRTGFIDVGTLTKLYVESDQVGGTWLGFYDSSKKYIGGDSKGFNRLISLADGTRYVMACIKNSGKEQSTNFSVSNFVKHTAEIPISLTSLEDYGCSCPKGDGSGTLYNWIDFENGVYHHAVKKIKGKDATWESTSDSEYLKTTKYSSIIKKVSSNSNVGDVICGKFETNYNLYTGQCVSINASGHLGVYKSGKTTLSDFTDLIADVDFVFALAQEEVIDISDIIRPLKVESGGTVTFVNEHNIDCDTVVKYKKEV